MKRQTTLILAAFSFILATSVLCAQPPIPNPLIDYAGFQKIVDTADTERESRRLSEDSFLSMMNAPGTVVLDARSSAMYRLRHIKVAANLPFTDFSAASLAGVVPGKQMKILIYCNNNS